jgi:hypothetical protein
MRIRLAFAAVLVVSLGCSGGLRHIATLADVGYSQAVFALDDAEFNACQTGVLTPAQCVALNSKVKQALEDVKVITAYIQAMPKSTMMPASLPYLLRDLSDLRAALAALLTNNPAVDVLLELAKAAENKSLELLRSYGVVDRATTTVSGGVK